MDQLAEAVRDVLGSEFPPDQFRPEESSAGLLVLTSSDLSCRFALSPRGEFEVTIGLPGIEAWKGWVYAGFVGSADLTRLLEIVGEQIRSEPRILRADPAFYADLARQREQEQVDYNRRAAGVGRPYTRRNLP